MFVYKMLAMFLAGLLTVVETTEDLPNVIIGDPNHPSSDIAGPAISDAEFEAALANEDLLTYQPETNSPLTNQYAYFQGDIQVKSKDQLTEIMLSKEKGGQSSAISNPSLKWPNAQIPYVISSSFSAQERAVIVRAMAEYHQETCIKFIPKTTHTNYIHILKGQGCSSMVGRAGGAQSVSLGYGCVNFGTVIHELMHATGFWHEQSRFDRDTYVSINWSNILQGLSYNFNKKTPSVTQDLGLPYDYSSVMHYDQYAFAQDRSVPTIYARQQGVKVLGQRKGFSQLDKKGLNLLYQCSGTTKPKPTGNCVDTNQFCSDWATKGQCNSNPGYMHVSCKKSCNKCGTTVKPVNPVKPTKPTTACVDKHQYCSSWAKIGYCSSNAAYMRPTCPKSCNVCDGGSVTTNCVDNNAFCPDWASKGQCNSNPAYMHMSCKKSCNKCT